jgi:hypothetical protein
MPRSSAGHARFQSISAALPGGGPTQQAQTQSAHKRCVLFDTAAARANFHTPSDHVSFVSARENDRLSMLYRLDDLIDPTSLRSFSLPREDWGSSLMACAGPGLSGFRIGVRINLARIAELQAPSLLSGRLQWREKFSESSRNELGGPTLNSRRQPTPPAQAPPQHGPDRKIRPTCFSGVSAYKPMKWLAKPPCGVQAWSIHPGRSSVRGAICWPS